MYTSIIKISKNEKLICTMLYCSLISQIISTISGCFYYDYEYELSFNFPNVAYVLLNLSPIILLILYVKFFQKSRTATVILPILCGITAITPMITCTYYITSTHGLIYIITNLLYPTIPYILLLVSMLKGLRKKLYLIIASTLGIILPTIRLLYLVLNINSFLLQDAISNFFSYISAILFSISLLLFGINHQFPPLFKVSSEKEIIKYEKMPTEQALRMLKASYEFGEITEEEYQAKKAEIINRI